MFNNIIKRCQYPHKNNKMQRIRKEQLENGTVKKQKDEEYKYSMIRWIF